MICHPGRSVPGSLPNKQVTIESSANIYPSSKGSYNVSVLNPIPIVTSITPGSFSEGMAQIVVNGSSFVYGAQILWNGVAIPTTHISRARNLWPSSRRTYRALIRLPWSIPIQVQHLRSASNALVSPGQVVILLQPTETSVRVNNTITITSAATPTWD
jgi:hypothetical protein